MLAAEMKKSGGGGGGGGGCLRFHQDLKKKN